MTELFVDTSIVIRHSLGSKEIRSRIEERFEQYDHLVTGLVVRQEYKRRLLREGDYLLRTLDRKGSLDALHDHVLNVLPPQQGRKMKIALNLIRFYFPDADKSERTERFRRSLRSLLRVGLRQFDEMFDKILWDSGCACAKFPVVEVELYKKYDFGPINCSRMGASCDLVSFLRARDSELNAIVTVLKELRAEEKSEELRSIEGFISSALANLSRAPESDPCLKLGDLLIALESATIDVVYTMNYKESATLCRALGQTAVVRSNDPGKPDTFLST
jgi:hypothetical protein